jgi:dimethylhistidine N-methyltransferase
MTFPITTRLPALADDRAAIVANLMAPTPFIEPRYFYDPQGCALYEAITALEEYYPTRTEHAIMAEHASALAQAVGAGGQMIDLGSGDSEKAARLLPHLRPSAYLAVDIAESAIRGALPKLAKIAPAMALAGLVTDFSEKLEVEGLLSDARRTFFYPGSSIGNFSPDQAVAFLARIRSQCRPAQDGLLIGVDSVKDKDRLDAAYDDALGVTAAFNLNALRHLNRRIRANFDVRDWQHRGFFNAAASRIEMHLEAKCDVRVTLGAQTRVFRAGERIHTEDSYKYSRAGFEACLKEAGFSPQLYASNPANDFHVFYATAV